MSPSTTADPSTWETLAHDWRHSLAEWAQWWQRASAMSASGGASSALASAFPVRVPALDGVAVPFIDAAASLDPEAVAELNARYQQRFAMLWSAAQQALATPGASLPDIVPTPANDRRFVNAAWQREPYFAYLKQTYLLYAEYLAELAALAHLPAEEKHRLLFATRQYIDAIAPTNFPATNPEVVKRAIETEGASLVEGMRHLVEDAGKGRITMTDESAFAIGRNIAVTPGSVVYRNELIELIQYDATTPQVNQRPLLIVPPCINKYYILDLKPDNSFVRDAVAHGHTTFMVSWRNVPPELGHLTWDDYVEQGVLEALRVVTAIAGSRTANVLGFCVGGTLLACALAVLAARRDMRAASVTLLTTMLDFADPGDIGVYISREGLAMREPMLCAGQRVHGSELANAFASLRPNELVWNYVVNNYLKGRVPPAFDLLYWNGDSANLPGPMYAYYLREFYLGNRLREPGALTAAGAKIDLSRITIPAYVYASREDHIVPWRSAYKTCALLGGEPTFVLGSSGHIAGVVNPPASSRRSYWLNELITENADDWLARARNVQGSWWPHWQEWLAAFGNGVRKAPRHVGNKQFPALDPAPGRYVLEPA